MNNEFRSGIGFDVHAFAENRKLILGGVVIPNEKGLSGHSDADVLIHAICDALLGSLALGDIGQHFPDNNPKFKDADSSVLLSEVYKLVKKNGYSLCNADATIILQNPKVSPYILQMREKIALIFQIEIGQVSIKATTTENLGFTGREEGVAAIATVLVKKV